MTTTKKHSPYIAVLQFLKALTSPSMVIFLADWNFSGDQEESKNDSAFSACVAQVAYDELQQFTGDPGHALIK